MRQWGHKYVNKFVTGFWNIVRPAEQAGKIYVKRIDAAFYIKHGFEVMEEGTPLQITGDGWKMEDFALQVVITQFGGMFFGTVPLGFVMWLKILGTGFTVVVISEIMKLIKGAV